MRNAASKIVSRERLRDLLAGPKRQGRRVVFANGCFDTLHVGHVRFLEGARREAILAEAARVDLVAALRAVDYVVLFSEHNVEALLEYVRPDVHAKGTDYTAETVPERAAVLAAGGKVVIAGDPKTHATRDLIRTIVERFGRSGR